MPQTVQLLRTLTNNAPGALLAGELSVEMGGHTKLWVGSHTGNRLLISDNPAELPAAGAGYLSLLGGQLSGDLRIYSGATLRMGLVNEDPNSIAGGIEMYPGSGGFGVTSSTLNYNWTGTQQFISGGVPIMHLTYGGMQMQSALYLLGDPHSPTMAASKNYVDNLVGAVESVTKLAGSYDAAADLVRPVQGVSVAGPLPAPGALNQGWYLIIEIGGIGIGNAPPVEMAVGDWIISTGEAWVHLDLNLSTVEAANVAVVPIPGLVSTNVQGALEELPTKAYVDAHDPGVGKYLSLNGGVLTGDLGIDANGVRYNGSNAIAFAWNGSAVQALVDGTGSPGALATQSYVANYYLALSGGALTGGIDFSSGVVDDPQDVSRHIALWGGGVSGYGFSVTASTLNYNAVGATSRHAFYAGTELLISFVGGTAVLSNLPISLPGDPVAPEQATTRRYVDNLVGAVEAVTKLAGAYDAASDLIRPVQGVSVAGPLPAASALNQGWYLIIETGGVGIGNAPPVEMAVGDWIISTGEAWVHLDLNLSTVEAANVAIVPIPGLFSTNVQGALEELPTKAYVDAHDPAVGNYLPIGGGNLTGQLGVAGAGISYNGSNLIAFSWTGGALAASVDGSGTPGALATQQFALDQDAAIYNWTSANFLTFGGGTLSGALTAPAFYATGVVQSTVAGRVISHSAGNNPSVTVWDSNLSAAAGMLLDGNNNLMFASMNGDGSYAATRAYIDPAGALFTMSNAVVGGALFADDVFLDPGQTYALYTGSDGTRWLQFNTGWAWGYQAATGNLVWTNAQSGAYNVTFSGLDGYCYNLEGAWRTFSDARLKQDIEDYTPGLDAIIRLRPRTFRRIAEVQNEARDGRPARRAVGVIAQEIETVIPECVLIESRTFDGASYDDLRSYDGSPLLYTLVNAIKEIHARLLAGGL